MTTKVLTTYIAAGYTLSASYSELFITASGGVGGTGVDSEHAATIVNSGSIHATVGVAVGVDLKAGGAVTNMAAGYIGGIYGVFSHAPVAVANYGTIRATTDAIYSDAGGSVVNGSYAAESATIAGLDVFLNVGPSSVKNLGTILAQVYLNTAGTVTNGGVGDTTALIRSGKAFFGYIGVGFGAGLGVVTNFGTIQAPGFLSNGVSLGDGGQVTNGTAIDTGARIEGYTGVSVAQVTGTVTNWGTILGVGADGGRGVYLAVGGRAANGGAGDTAALIEGASGVVAYGAATVTNYGAIVGATAYGVQMGAGGALINGTAIDQGALVRGYTGGGFLGAATVTNWGSIEAVGLTSGGDGLYLEVGGQVTNGGAGDTAALVEGASGIIAEGALTLANFGLIDGLTGVGVELRGGLITDGGAGAHTAQIEGYRGVVASDASTVKNFGTVRATGFAGDIYGVQLLAGGQVVNGSRHNSAALISGYNGLLLDGPGTVTNFGTVLGAGDNLGYGAEVIGGVTVTNGDAGHTTALIEGYTGLAAYGTGDTVINFGTVLGAGGTAVRFSGANDTLVVEAGCAFGGAVMGGGGVLVLGSGSGTLSGAGTGTVTVSGSMAPTIFQAFDTVEVGQGASFTTAGAVQIAAGQTLSVAGALSLGAGQASLANAGSIQTLGGTLTVAASVTGGGVAVIDRGTLDLTAGFNQAVTFGATGVLELARSQSYTAAVSGFSKTGKTAFDLADIAFTGAGEATYSGTKKKGVLTVSDGTHTAHIVLIGNYLSATWVASSDGHGGTFVVDPQTRAAAPPVHRLVGAMAAMGASHAAPVQLSARGPLCEALLAGPRPMAA